MTNHIDRKKRKEREAGPDRTDDHMEFPTRSLGSERASGIMRATTAPQLLVAC